MTVTYCTTAYVPRRLRFRGLLQESGILWARVSHVSQIVIYAELSLSYLRTYAMEQEGEHGRRASYNGMNGPDMNMSTLFAVRASGKQSFRSSKNAQVVEA